MLAITNMAEVFFRPPNGLFHALTATGFFRPWKPCDGVFFGPWKTTTVLFLTLRVRWGGGGVGRVSGCDQDYSCYYD